MNVAVTNNTLNYGGTQNAISIAAGQDGTNSTSNITVTGNNINIQQDGTTDPIAGIIVSSAVASPSGDGAKMCADIGGATAALKNTYTHSMGVSQSQGDIRVRHRFPGDFRLPGYVVVQVTQRRW